MRSQSSGMPDSPWENGYVDSFNGKLRPGAQGRCGLIVY